MNMGCCEYGGVVNMECCEYGMLCIWGVVNLGLYMCGCESGVVNLGKFGCGGLLGTGWLPAEVLGDMEISLGLQ